MTSRCGHRRCTGPRNQHSGCGHSTAAGLPGTGSRSQALQPSQTGTGYILSSRAASGTPTLSAGAEVTGEAHPNSVAHKHHRISSRERLHGRQSALSRSGSDDIHRRHPRRLADSRHKQSDSPLAACRCRMASTGQAGPCAEKDSAHTLPVHRQLAESRTRCVAMFHPYRWCSRCHSRYGSRDHSVRMICSWWHLTASSARSQVRKAHTRPLPVGVPRCAQTTTAIRCQRTHLRRTKLQLSPDQFAVVGACLLCAGKLL